MGLNHDLLVLTLEPCYTARVICSSIHWIERTFTRWETVVPAAAAASTGALIHGVCVSDTCTPAGARMRWKMALRVHKTTSTTTTTGVRTLVNIAPIVGVYDQVNGVVSGQGNVWQAADESGRVLVQGAEYDVVHATCSAHHHIIIISYHLLRGPSSVAQGHSIQPVHNKVIK